MFRTASLLLTLCAVIGAETADRAPAQGLDLGYRQMYNLEFEAAHQTFAAWERANPSDPMGPASNAAAYLFAEFDRLHILQGEFFVHDEKFKRLPKMTPDPAVKQKFQSEIARAQQLSFQVLQRIPTEKDALFVSVLALGLRADYDALIEKKYFDSLSGMKEGRTTAEKLLSIDPTYYDAYLAVGVENYMLSLKPAPVRWFLQMGGLQTDEQRGIEKLKLTAEKGHYLLPFARLLLAVAALRDKKPNEARAILADLVQQFPKNNLYAEELARLR